MGIIDFVRDAGRKIGLGDRTSAEKSDATASPESEELRETKQAQKLLAIILEMNQGVENPRLEFDDGVATVWGKAPNQKVKENTILVIGNIEGVARVDDRMEVKEPAPESTFYTVKPGDSLSAIAREFYGDASAYTRVFEANTPMLKDPDLIYPGQVLRIPKV